jgi:hypothetical protein
MITKDEAVEMLRATVSGEEEYVDQGWVDGDGCRYASYESDDKDYEDYPGCLIGQVFSRLGATREQLVAMDRCGGTIVALARDGDIPFEVSDSALLVFAAAQNQQDEGKPWGEALDAALAVAREDNQ